ncbi:pilus assembly protein PilM [Candidatus Nomurabacteria bacterium]|nr:pilus assembly protein PilM [Candidatus Nomurabacteria bacterium]
MSLQKFVKFFDTFFPVPSFLSAPSFGLDIGDESIKFIELINIKQGMRVGRHGERVMPAGIIEAGKIKNGKRLEEILSELRVEAGLKSVRVSVPEQQVYLFKIRLGKSGLESVRESIELALEEHVPVQASEAIFDYELLLEDAESLYLQVAVIPKNVIEEYLTVFNNSKIWVESFELEAQAIARAIVKKGDPETYMIVDFGEKRTGIFIISRGFVMFTSTLDFGGVVLNEMIMKNFKISFEEAEKMKRKYGLLRNTENRELFSVLLNSVSILRDEIAKHFLYWHTHKDEEGKNNPPIKKIILCGGDSNLIGLSDYFSVSIKIPVFMADVWVNIADTENYVPDMNFKQALSFAASLGLALRDYERN